MRLVRVALTNFRAFKGTNTLRVEPLTALIGRNDVGKSSVLDALGIFFGHELCEIDSSDRCVHAQPDANVAISCTFIDLPSKLILDDSAETTLADEWLLDGDGNLTIRKVFSGDKLKEEVVAVANHPTAPDASDLLTRKNAELKQIAAKLGAQADGRSNVALRKAIRNAVADLKPAMTEVPLVKEGGKELWSSLQRHLPVFALFRSDRPSTDEDGEVQDPMKIAIREALVAVAPELQKIKEQVEKGAVEVAERTLLKLADLDPKLAATLSPRFRAEPKWDSLFKLSLVGDYDIPINKRGSGARRLLLLGFFQAEVERRREAQKTANLIYAIEEPETSQHPKNQVAVVEALKELATVPGTQVLLTTHVPALAGMLPVSGIQHVTSDSVSFMRSVEGGEDILKRIATDLGVYPDLQDRHVQVIVCVEGPTDVEFLRNIAPVLRSKDNRIPDLAGDRRIAIIPLGGDTLKDWVNRQYLKGLEMPEVHIYDGDKADYVTASAEVNARKDGSWATVTAKREIENYYHADIVKDVLGVTIVISDNSDVEADLKAALGSGRFQGRSIKRVLADDVAPRMTIAHLKARGGFVEIQSWLQKIATYVH
jgi:putative ATP-dependent endonuclease of the OLD family